MRSDWTGAASPVPGWIAGGARDRDNIPSPAVICTRQGKLPVTLGWALEAYPGGDAPQIQLENLPVRRRARDARSTDATGLKAVGPNGREDTVMISHVPGVMRFGPYECDSDLALITTDKTGTIVRVGLVGGTFLTREGVRLVSSEQTMDHLSLVKADGSAKIHKGTQDHITITV